MSDQEQTDDVEYVEETMTDAVTVEYAGEDTLDRILVEATWVKRAEKSFGEIEHSRTEDSVTAYVEYKPLDRDDSMLALSGFYPNTTKTGDMLYRETLKALRVIEHAHWVVADNMPDGYGVYPYSMVIDEELGEL
jgi:hypothetical protein